MNKNLTISLKDLMATSNVASFEDLCKVVSNRLHILASIHSVDSEIVTKTTNLLVELGTIKEALQKSGVVDVEPIAEFIVVRL